METVGLRAKHLPYPVCLQRGSSFASLLGFIFVANPNSLLLLPPLLPDLCFPTGYCLMLNPRKLNPGGTFSPLNSISFRVWQILVFSGFSFRPMGFNHSEMAILHCSITSRLLDIATKSSAYLINVISGFELLYFPGNLSFMCLAIPSSAMLARSGLMTPPCGVPASVSSNTPLSNTPALSHCLTFRRIVAEH